jgi:hypothetical protein
VGSMPRTNCHYDIILKRVRSRRLVSDGRQPVSPESEECKVLEDVTKQCSKD